MVLRPDEIASDSVRFDINGKKNYRAPSDISFIKPMLKKYPIYRSQYQKGFDLVQQEINAGNTYLLNLTYVAERRQCAVRCSTTCQHGLKLDATGCPANNVCECRDACADVECRQQDEVYVHYTVTIPYSSSCVPERAQCTDGVCPPIPTCKPNSCGAQKPAKDSDGRWAVCSGVFANDCAPTNTECVMIPGEATLGLCCNRGMVDYCNLAKFVTIQTIVDRHGSRSANATQ